MASRVGQGYIAAQGAMLGILPFLAKEFSAAGVWVNAVVPALVVDGRGTPVADGADSIQMEEVACASPRLLPGGGPEEVAEMVVFLLSPLSRVSGEVIRLNGGGLDR